MGIPGPKLVVPDPHNAFIALTGFGPGTPMLKACPIRTHINHIIIIIIIKIKACPIHTHAVAGSREESHALCTHVDEEKENVVHVPIKRGSITVHDERVVHGSGANRSNFSTFSLFVYRYGEMRMCLPSGKLSASKKKESMDSRIHTMTLTAGTPSTSEYRRELDSSRTPQKITVSTTHQQRSPKLIVVRAAHQERKGFCPPKA
eukprot:1137735-Pelagomonas_calceolata.AAC.4